MITCITFPRHEALPNFPILLIERLVNKQGIQHTIGHPLGRPLQTHEGAERQRSLCILPRCHVIMLEIKCFARLLAALSWVLKILNLPAKMEILGTLEELLGCIRTEQK